MQAYDDIKSELIDLTREFAALIERAGATNGVGGGALEKSLASCHLIQQQLNEETIRVAVVGPIKSGKSSFANAILGGDYLKRGAGVVTSFVTRVNCGQTLKAELQFKTWDEINEDIEHALVLFPTMDWQSQNDGFDIRRQDQRQALRRHRGQTILVVGHSDTTPALAGLLAPGQSFAQFSDDDYANLYIIVSAGLPTAQVLRLKF